MSKLSNLFKKESPTSSKLAKWLELTSIGVICTFGGFFVYHYTQTFAQSSPTEQRPSVQKSPIVMNTVVTKDANEQMMENLPSKNLETSLKVKPIPYEGTVPDGEVPNTGNAASIPPGSSDTVELPDTSIVTTPSTTPESGSIDLPSLESTEPTNPIEIITDPEYALAEGEGEKVDKKHSNPITAAIQKPKPTPVAKEKPTPITKPVITKPVTSKPSTSTSTSKPSTSISTSKPSTSTSTSKPSTSTSTSKPSTSTSTSKPSTSTSTSTSKPSTSISTSKPSKPKAPYAVQENFPGTKYFKTGAKNKYVTQLGYMLVAAGYGKYYKVGPGPEWTSADFKNTQAFQRSQGWTGSDADGYPGPETWKRLYKKYYTKYSH
jgi:hypothetical protein